MEQGLCLHNPDFCSAVNFSRPLVFQHMVENFGSSLLSQAPFLSCVIGSAEDARPGEFCSGSRILCPASCCAYLLEERLLRGNGQEDRFLSSGQIIISVLFCRVNRLTGALWVCC